jgi:hypothetical protein
VLRRSLGTILTITGTSPTVLYVNGAAGDVSTRFTRHAQDFAEVERVGLGLADAAMEALARARPLSDSLRFAGREVVLSARTESDHVEGRRSDTAPSTEPTSDATRRLDVTKTQGTILLQRLLGAGPGAIRTSFELHAWAVGELALVAVPGELFASLGASAVAASQSPALVLGYANGYVGYLADRAAYEIGTYEALASPYAPGAGERVVVAARTLIDLVQSDDIATGWDRRNHVYR